MKKVSKKKEEEFIQKCLKLWPIVYHTKTTIWPLREVFKLQDYKRAVKNFIKQTIFFFKGRENLPKNKLKILICPDGGIGDIVLSRLFVYKLKKMLPNSFISVAFKNKKVLQMLFENQNLADLITTNAYKKDYDLVYSGFRLFAVKIKNKKEISKFVPGFLPCLKRALYLQEFFKVFYNTPVAIEYPLIQTILSLGLNVREANFWLNGFEDFEPEFPPYTLPKAEEQKVLKKFGLNDKKYITIHDGFDTNFKNLPVRNKKCWPREHWLQFVKLFKKVFPDILIVQLGATNSVVFEGVDISLINKTDLLDLPYILKNSLLHLDGESGLSHLRTALGKISIVMIGPSTKKYSLYDGNINILSRHCSECMDIKSTWQSVCMLNQKPDCMTSILPQRVFMAAKRFLDGKSVKEILDLDLKENPYSSKYKANLKALQNICEQNLPYAKIGYNFGPEKITRPIINFISKPSQKFFK